MALSWFQETYIKAYQFAAQAHQGQLMTGINFNCLIYKRYLVHHHKSI